VVEIKRFFDKLDREEKGFITADDYARNFNLMSNSNKHARNVFETLDKRKAGKLSLDDFFRENIPHISKKDMERVRGWIR